MEGCSVTIGSQDWEGLTLSGGRYRITAKLGEGGMGFVYRALDQNIDAEVVIKVPRQAMMDDPEFAGRFTREIRSLVKLSHPHIVKVSDVGTVEGVPFAVMQFLPGGSLEDQRPVGPDGRALACDPRKISGWLGAVADALDYIHTQGWVHRDVKPGNILFDSQGHAFLSDFGVAKALASSPSAAPSQTAATGAGMVLGTPEYMAPELIMGEPFDGRVDQYALAITVYELLCGRRPFEDETKTKVLVLHTSKLPPALTEWSNAFPEKLSQVVLKGLAKDPAARYPRCADLARAVAAAVEGLAAQDGRVRLKCTACGRTASMPAADFARLKESGKRAPCPACKTPIDVSSAVHVAPGASPGGTMKFSIAGNPGEYALSSETLPAAGGTAAFNPLAGPSGTLASPATAHAAPGGTMALSAQTKPVPRQGSGTLIERTLPRSPDAAAADVFKGLTGTEQERLGTPKAEKPVEFRAKTPNKNVIWIAAGAGAAAVLVAAIGVAFLMISGSKKAPDADSAAQTAATRKAEPNASQTAATRKTASNAAQTAAGSSKEPSTIGALAKAAEMPAAPTSEPDSEPSHALDLAARAEGRGDSGGRPGGGPSSEMLAAKDFPGPTRKQQLKARTKNANPGGNRPQSPPPPSGFFATNKFESSRLPKKLTNLEYAPGKNLEKARTRRGEILNPGGMYLLARANSDNPFGTRKFRVTECALDEVGSRRVLELVPKASSEVEVEPRLASRLDQLDPRFLHKSVAILTLLIDSSGDCGIVRAELLEKCEPRLKPGFGIGQADVEYYAMAVSPDEQSSNKSPDELWQKVGRMNHFFSHWKHRVDAMKRLQETLSMARLTNVMGSMYSDAMKGAANDAAMQRALQRGVGGR
jgi:hypothetical protein